MNRIIVIICLVLSNQCFTQVDIDTIFINFLKCNLNDKDTIIEKYDSDSVVIIKVKTYSKGIFKKDGTLNVLRFFNSKVNEYRFYQFDKEMNLSISYKIVNNLKSGWYCNLFENYYRFLYYHEGKKEGVGYDLDIENNKIISIFNYKNDSLNGKQLFFYPSGLIKKSCSYKSGIPFGEYISYHDNGLIKEVGFWEGYYKCSLNKVTFEENWYLNGEIVDVKNLPNYIPKLPSNEFQFDYFYPRKTGEWIEYNNKGKILNRFLW